MSIVKFLCLTLFCRVFAFSTSVYCMEVAITIDDLPENGFLPLGHSRQQIANKVLSVLKKHHLNGIYGFLNAKHLEFNPEEYDVLDSWRQSGNFLGNHGYSHLDLAKTSSDEYIADIKKNEPVLTEFMVNQNFHYYRYPFLAEGETKEKRDVVRNYLEHNDYQIAQVTVDYFEYEWNAPYVRCKNQNNQKALNWLKENYLTQAENALTIASSLSQMLYKRDIKHILLIHINAFTAEMLDKLLTSYEQHGVKFISLEDALSDKAYTFNPDIARDRSYTFLNQMRLAKEMDNPKIVQELYDSFPEEKLALLCQ